MCGVLGLIFEKENQRLGLHASKLLHMLEYRGYDSTGAVIQDEKNNITLLKDVGAPSKLTKELGIDKLSGQIFCGQVRWATFGVVNKLNAQPHEVNCKIRLYGAHNGNITNCNKLKEWLVAEGHDVKSDNDGEMLVHTVEHFFADELKNKSAHADRRSALKKAVVRASKKMVGSFAAVLVDPVSKTLIGIKAGSSFYIGRGYDEDCGSFIIASSDLASVLQFTKILIPIQEKKFVLFNHEDLELFDLKDGKQKKIHLKRTNLKSEETRLKPPYEYFMEQEIHSQVDATKKLVTLFTGGSAIAKYLAKQKNTGLDLICDIEKTVVKLSKITDNKILQAESQKFFNSPQLEKLKKIISKSMAIKTTVMDFDLVFESSYASFIEELKGLLGGKDKNMLLVMKFIDAIFELNDVRDVEQRIENFIRLIFQAKKAGGSIYVLACGTSFHAAKTAAVFFNDIAKIQLMPLLPGEFRAQCAGSLKDGDVLVGISQSGETKDLIDVFNYVISSGKKIKRITFLNNVNSTLGIEKSDLYFPLFCGPEVAVPATKSFINQLLMFYALSIRIFGASAKTKKEKLEVNKLYKNLQSVPGLIKTTIKTTQKEVEEISNDLFQQPSMHILATRILGIAKEGALKIREVVLNHTEGFEGSEFKHGPNTILGVNTVFGMDSVCAILDKFSEAFVAVFDDSTGKNISARSLQKIFKAVKDFAFNDIGPKYLNNEEMEIFKSIFIKYNFFESMYDNYPLIFITCPTKLDINLTVSQINTHKIRGANVFVIAEDDESLREAASVSPSGSKNYKYNYVTLPRTGDAFLPFFSITVVLQLIALKMSLKKMKHLNRLEIKGHGVHPDVPKNVSKSITVD